MGVLACNRNGCENIMCDYFSYQYDYLCSECKEELVRGGPQDIQEFLDSPKKSVSGTDIENWAYFVEGVFKLR